MSMKSLVLAGMLAAIVASGCGSGGATGGRDATSNDGGPGGGGGSDAGLGGGFDVANTLPTPLLRTEPELAGSNCPNGGTALRLGLDVNHDGMLEDSEVTSTSYLCNATPNGSDAGDGGGGGSGGSDAGIDGGVDAANSPAPLLRTEPEPAGSNCPNGGTALDLGLDVNHDGMLEASEVTSTSYLCNGTSGGTLEGSITLRNSFDVATLSMFSEVTGNVTVDATGVTKIVLPGLAKIGGTLEVISGPMESLELPGLESVGSIYASGTPPPLTAPNLVTVTGTLSLLLAGDLQWTEVAFPSLQTAETINISAVGPVNLPGLVTVGALQVQAQSLDMSKLTSATSVNVQRATEVAFALLQTAQAIDIEGATEVAFPSLQTVPMIHISGGGTVSMPSLVSVTGLQVTAKSLDVPKLTSATSVDVEGATGAITAPLLNGSGNPPSVTVAGDPAGTATVNLHGLQAGCLQLTNLASLDLASLAETPDTVGCKLAYSGVGMTALVLPALTRASLAVVNGGQGLCTTFLCLPPTYSPTTLQSVEAPVLAEGKIDISYTQTLTSISLPALTTIDSGTDQPFRIRDNPVLTHVVLDKLTSTPSFEVVDNPMLPSCQVAAILAAIAPPPAIVGTTGNGTGSCP